MYSTFVKKLYENVIYYFYARESATKRSSREPPKDAGAILAEVGLTPEALQGKTVLYFGNEPLVVEGANITPFDFDHYIETDELGVGEDGVDYVIAVGESMLQDALGDEDRQILLGQVAETLKTPGESVLRIAKPYLSIQAVPPKS